MQSILNQPATRNTIGLLDWWTNPDYLNNSAFHRNQLKQKPPDNGKFHWPLTNVDIPAFVLVLLISIGAGFGVWMSVLAIAKIKQILPRIKQRLPFR